MRHPVPRSAVPLLYSSPNKTSRTGGHASHCNHGVRGVPGNVNVRDRALEEQLKMLMKTLEGCVGNRCCRVFTRRDKGPV